MGYRHRHVWLRPCRRSTAAGNSSTNKPNFSQLQNGKACCATELSTLSSVGLRWNTDAAVPGVSCATAAQPQNQQGKYVKPGLPDISELSVHLQQEWHPDNNSVLGGIKVKPYSKLKVMWSCPNCPAGCPHIWKTSVSNRSRGTNCPYCEGRTVCEHSSLATKAPSQLQYWNQDKNAKTPEQTIAGSCLRAYWKCPDCSHEWQGQVAQRARKDSGCPRCSNKAPGREKKHPTFEAAQHQLLHEWDYERNATDGIHPSTTTLGSKKLVHWVCHNCPKGQLHRYQMYAFNRAGKHTAGCPYCAGHQVCKCNSLQTHYPMIASEWDSAKNDLMPAQVTSRSNQVVWWQNCVRGSWAQNISQRTNPRVNPR